jgi:hypothetical protein
LVLRTERFPGRNEATLALLGIVQTTFGDSDEYRVRLVVEELLHSPDPGTGAAYLAEG